MDAQRVAHEVRALVENDLAIDTVEIPHEPERFGLVVLRGRLRGPSAEIFPRWLTEMNRRGYTPLLRPDPDGVSDEHVILRIVAGIAPKTQQRPIVNVILFVVTLFSTFLAGAWYWSGSVNRFIPFEELLLPQNLIRGWPFALTLMGILAAHEFGHYFAARYHQVAVTLPYFLPLPPPISFFGTLGAFIRLKEPISDRRKLFDIGVAGPLAGLVLAVPLLFVGLSTSPVEPTNFSGGLLEGNSLLYYYAKLLVFGETLPNFAEGRDVIMNQVTWAAWIGLLVTALNLLPVGQLDGGHTVFAVFGERARTVNIVTLMLMGLLGLAGIVPLQRFIPGLEFVGFAGWFVWLALIMFIIGPFHPPALDDVTELDPRRRWIGYFVILVFIVTFVPVPLRPL